MYRVTGGDDKMLKDTKLAVKMAKLLFSKWRQRPTMTRTHTSVLVKLRLTELQIGKNTLGQIQHL